MNDVPNLPSASEHVSPFVATTTPVIERANRLISVRTNPGFYDILQISKEIVESATAVLLDYGGWDAMQISLLKTRAQAAKEHHELLISRIQDAIMAGVAEAKAQTAILPEKTVAEALEQGDYVRTKVLEKFDDYDSRPSGSF